MTARRLILATSLWFLAVVTVCAQAPTESEFARRATWEAPKPADVRAQVLKWLEEEKPDAELRAKILAQWPADGAAAEDQGLLDRVAATLALSDPRMHALVEQCAKSPTEVPPPSCDWLAEDEVSALARDNLRLLYGRWLVQNQFYDEALGQLSGLDPKDVVDPASLLFYESVAYHRLLDKEQGLQSLGRLMERKGELPRRFEALAELMTADLVDLEDESLDHISRRMDDIKRRLELARVGKTVRGIEDGVIKSLDKMIDDMEQKRQQMMAAASRSGSGKGRSGNPRDTRSTAPAQDSRIAEGKAPGEVDRKPIGNKSGWGELPPKERDEALQQIGKDFPPHYREAIEQYFRRLASDNSDGNQK